MKDLTYQLIVKGVTDVNALRRGFHVSLIVTGMGCVLIICVQNSVPGSGLVTGVVTGLGAG